MIWHTLDRQRFFDIPEDVALPDGDLELRSAGGARRSVDAPSAEAFEVDRNRANDLLAAGIDEAWSRLREGLGRLTDVGRSDEGAADTGPRLDEETARRFREAVDVFRSKLNEALTDPDVQRTVGDIGRELGGLMQGLKQETSKLDEQLRRMKANLDRKRTAPEDEGEE